MTCSRLANCSKLSFKVALTNSTFIARAFVGVQETLFLQQWEILTVACAASVSVDFHNRERTKNFGLSLLWKPTETRARLTCITITLFILIGFWLATYDKVSRSLKRGKLTSRDRNYLGAFCKIPTFAGKRFFHSLPPSPLAPFFHSFPFLAQQNYQIFLYSENPQKRLLRRLGSTEPPEPPLAWIRPSGRRIVIRLLQ